MLTPQLPYPPHQGTSLRNYHIIRGLAEQNEVHLLSLVETNQTASPGTIGPLLALCASVRTVPVPERTTAQRLWRMATDRRPDLAHRLQSGLFDVMLRQFLLGERFDVVQVEGIELARAMPLVREVSPGSKVVFDDHNAEAALQARAFHTDLREPRRWPAAAYSLIQSLRLRRYEAEACRAADAVTAVSEADAEILRGLVPGLTVTVIPNMIDVGDYARPVAGEVPQFDVVFSGKMDYRPNVDAMLWFGREIWPRIVAARPGTTWAIVGQKPHARLAWLAEEPGVTVTGRVDAIQPYLAGAGVYVMPLRMGSGTRLKLIEAMAAGKALVSTPLGAEGFPVSDSEQIVLAAEPEEFAGAVVALLADDARRARLGAAARAFAERYDWRRVVPAFEEVYDAVGGG
ncbi:MAG: glycosyltransferase [Anaerolineae bacterium]|nr:glycosyltransferase [Anaerolineae bacterium]